MSHAELVTFMRSALERHPPAMPADDPGLTTNEWAEAWDISIRYARDRLRALHKQGLLVVGHRDDVGIDGRRCRIPVYRAKA